MDPKASGFSNRDEGALERELLQGIEIEADKRPVPWYLRLWWRIEIKAFVVWARFYKFLMSDFRGDK